MDNVTKALLIAAAILIVIVIIALSVRLLHVNDDSGETTGEFVQEKTGVSSKTAVDEIEKVGGNVITLRIQIDRSHNEYDEEKDELNWIEKYETVTFNVPKGTTWRNIVEKEYKDTTGKYKICKSYSWRKFSKPQHRR